MLHSRSHSWRASVNAWFDVYCSNYSKRWLILCRHPFSVTPGYTFSWLCSRSQHSQTQISTHSSKYSYTNPKHISDTYPVDSNLNACCQSGFIHFNRKYVASLQITMTLCLNMWHYSWHQYWLFHPHILQELADPQGHNCLKSSPKLLPFLFTTSHLRTVLFIYHTKAVTSRVEYDILYERIKRWFEDKIIKVKYVRVSWW